MIIFKMLKIAKKYINLGFEINLVTNYGSHLGFNHNQYKDLGVKIISDEKELIHNSDLIIQLNLLENVGFEEVIVVVSDQYKDAIGEYLALAREEGLTTMNVSLSVVGESVGTAESLRLLNDKINGDFFVIHGDLVAEGVLNKLADLHRTKQSTVTMLLKDLRASQVEKKTDKKSGKKKKDDKPKRKKVKAGPDGPTFIGFDRNDNRVFYEKSINDMEEENPKIVVPKALLRRRPNIYVTDEMEDVRLYIFSRRVMDLLMAHLINKRRK